MSARTSSLDALADAGVSFLKLTKAGDYLPRKTKADATHRIEIQRGSMLATPLKRWPKRKANKQLKSKLSHLTDMDMPEIPQGATHVMYRNSRIEIIATVDAAGDFKNYRSGELIYGKYFLSSDRFESMMPEKPKSLIEEVDGICRCPPGEHRTMKAEVEAHRERMVHESAKPAKKLPKPPAKANGAAPAPVANPAPSAPKAPKALRPANGESVCGFIDGLIAEGGRTAQQVLELVLAKFPGRDAKATMNTVRARPAHMRKAGKNPPPFLK